jgi:plasmid stability protein
MWSAFAVTKNITLAIDEDLLDKARVLAAMRRTSVNAMVREFLDREVRKETEDASRAEAWTRLFKDSDAVHAEFQDSAEHEAIFDRDAFYDEVMRERGLL